MSLWKRKRHHTKRFDEDHTYTDPTDSMFRTIHRGDVLTNNKSADRIKKFSYIDSQGIRQTLEKKEKEKKSEMDLEVVGRYMNIGYMLVIPMLLGVLLGIYLDTKFHTKPLFTVGLIVLGAIISIYNLFSLVRNENASSGRSSH